MESRTGQLRKDIVALLEGRPGWRLEPRTTPGASPLWCFVVQNEIVLSVTVEGESILLYVMATDEELAFEDADAIASWLRVHRPEAFAEAPPRPSGKERVRRMLEWS